MSVSAFAERLRNAMNSKELKQVDLVHAAERRGVKMGKSHISQYVAGKTMPREDVLLFLADELDVDANWLRGQSSETKLNSDAQPASHIDTPSGAPTSAETEIPATHRRFVSVRGDRCDQPVPTGDGHLYGLAAFVRVRHLKDAKTFQWHLDPIVQCDKFHNSFLLIPVVLSSFIG